MSFSSLKKQSSLGSLTSKLVKEIEKTSTTKVVLMSDFGNQNWISPVMVMLSFDFFLHLMVRIYLGQRFILMHSKVLVDGILRILLLLLVVKILYQNTIVTYGTAVMMLIRMLFVDRSASFLTMQTSTL